MKKTTISAFTLSAGIAMAMPATAQEAVVRQGDETARDMAIRIDACDGAGVVTAEFIETVEADGIRLRVECAAGAALNVNNMTGGLATGGAIAAGVLFLVIVGGAGASSGT